MRLQPCRLVGDHRIGRRVRLVEAVLGKLLHQVEELAGQIRILALGRSAFHEGLALLGHFLGLLLAHRPAQQVGTAQRVAGDDLRDLHHLLLVDDDPVGGLQAVLQVRMEVVDGLLAALSQDEVVHHARAQRPRPVQRQHGDDVLETVGLKLSQQLLHPVTFHLEDGDRVAVAQDLVGRLVVKAQVVQVHRLLPLARAPLIHVAHRQVDDGEVSQAQEVELHQAHRLHVVLVVLADHRIGARRPVERTEVRELARRNQHATGVHADVAGHVLQRPCQREQLRHLLLVGQPLGQLRLGLERLVQRQRLGLLDRDQLGELVAEVVGHVQHPARIADHRLAGHRAEGGNLRHRVVAVLAAHVLDHLAPVVLAEVDIEVGHRHPLRVQEALEQQCIRQRIQIGDAQRERHQRTRTRPPPRPHRHPVLLGPDDEVRHDEEVAREPHLDDGLALALEPRLVLGCLLRPHLRIGIELLQPLCQPVLGLVNQILLDRHPFRRRVDGQLRIAQPQRHRTAPRNLDRVGQRRRQVGEQRHHLRTRAEILRRLEAPHPLRIGQHLAFGNAHPRLVRPKILLAQELDGVRGHQRQVQLHRQPRRGPRAALGLGRAVALHLQIEGVRERRSPVLRRLDRPGMVACQQELAHLAATGPRQRNQPARRLRRQPFGQQLGMALVLILQPGPGKQLAQPPVAGIVGCNQQQPIRPITVLGIGDPDIGRADGLQPLARSLFVELHPAEQVGRIRQRQRHLPVGHGRRHGLVQPHDGVDHRILGTHPQMDKTRPLGTFSHRRHGIGHGDICGHRRRGGSGSVGRSGSGGGDGLAHPPIVRAQGPWRYVHRARPAIPPSAP